MKHWMSWLLVAVVLFSSVLVGNTVYAAPSTNTIYILPAITDSLILDSTAINSAYQGNTISLKGTSDEYVPAKFAIYAPSSISGMTITPSNLTGSAGTINSSAIDIRVVKCWYQAGYSTIYSSDIRNVTPVMVPELLLHDDTLVNVTGGQNYVKLTDGSYRLISQKASTSNDAPTVSSFPVKDDATTIQPVNIPAGTNKQFWVTVHIPTSSSPGTYTGTITLSGVGAINLNLEVLPFTLAPSSLTQSIYYYGILANGWNGGAGSIGYIKNQNQLKAELADMKKHGIDIINVYQPWGNPELTTFMQLYQAAGFNKNTLYYTGLQPNGGQDPSTVASVLSYMKNYGINSVYFYGKDEASGSTLTNQRNSWTAIRNAGGKIFVSGYTASQYSPGNYEGLGDIQDLQIQCDYYKNLTIAQRQAEATKWHSVGHKIFSYDNPQMGLELPQTYRSNFGLMLWQINYDGAMNYIYESAYGNVWNDWDDPGNNYKDHNMTYPTSNSVLDTLQWEGYMEGVTDTRYLATLQATISSAKTAGKDTSSAETWLANLKASTLGSQDLVAVRTQMVTYIKNLSGAVTPTPTPTPTPTVTSKPPAVTTSAASNITTNSATLNGNLSSLGTASSVSVSFDYGLTTSYGSSSAAQNINAAGNFNAALSSLTSNTTYHFRAKANGGTNGITLGGDQTFTTAASSSSSPKTFGYNSGSGIYTESPGRLDMARLQNTAGSGVLTGIELQFNQTSAQGKVRLGVYADNNGSVGNLLLDAGEVPAGTSWVGIYGLNLPVNSNSYYWLGYALSAANTLAFTSGGTHTANQSVPYGPLPSNPPITMTNTTPYVMRGIVNTGAISDAPTVTTISANNIANAGANLNGNLTSLGSASNVALSFEYGLTTSYGSSIDGIPSSLSVPGAFTANLSGLTPGTTYHFRAKANGGTSGTTLGNDQTFTTLASAPTAAFSMAVTVQFTDSSSGSATSWLWNFGDGTTSTVQNPSHIYTKSGTYTITETVTGPGGSSSASHTITLN